MKKTVSRVLLLALVTALLALVMTSCGGPSGKYTALGVVDLDFSGKNVTISIFDEELGTGTYEIKTGEDGNQKMTIEDLEKKLPAGVKAACFTGQLPADVMEQLDVAVA